MNKIPQIESIGDPPELHAQRVVSEMLKWLLPEHDRMALRAADALAGGKNGNPIAQQRSVDRLAKAMTTLDAALVPGKKGNFTVVLYDWGLWDRERDCEANIHRQNSEHLWLVAWRNIFVFERGKLVKDVSIPRLFFTYHFLHRLAERRGARSWEDLISALREVWQVYFEHFGEDLDALDAPPLRSIPLASGGCAMLERYEPPFEGAKARPKARVVVTVLTGRIWRS